MGDETAFGVEGHMVSLSFHRPICTDHRIHKIYSTVRNLICGCSHTHMILIQLFFFCLFVFFCFLN